jgi:cytochrome c-type biogenesis protein CcmH/NrfG
LKAIELDPNDDFAWHVLGRWHFGVANVGGATRAMAKLIYGGLPAASNEEAVRHFHRALEIAPRRIIHHRELARVYVAMGKPDMARKCWQAIVQLPGTDGEDAKARQEAEEALARPEKRENVKAPAASGR